MAFSVALRDNGATTFAIALSTAGTDVSDTQAIYLKGSATVSDNQPIYLKGQSSLSDNQPIFLSGRIAISDNQPIFLKSAGVARVGSATLIQNSNQTGSQSITVPSGADICVVVVSLWRDATNWIPANPISLNGSDLTTEQKTDESGSTAGHAWLGYLVNPSSGDLEWDWGATLAEGANILVLFYANVDTSNPIVSSGEEATADTDLTGLTASGADMMVGGMYSYTAITSVTDSGQTELQGSTVYNTAYFAAAEKNGGTGFYYTGGSYQSCVALVLKYAPEGTEVSDNQTIYLKGQSTAVDNQAIYLRGKLDTSDTQAIYLKGQITLTDTQPIYIRGQSTALDNQPIYLEGVPQPFADNQPIYLRGQLSLTDTQPIYMKGQATQSDSQPIYLAGIVGIVDTQPIYLKGLADLADSKAIYLKGRDSLADSQAIYLIGTAGISDTQVIYLKGQDSLTDSQPIYLAGYATLTDTQPIYLKGRDTALDNQPIYMNSAEVWPFYDDFNRSDSSDIGYKWKEWVSSGACDFLISSNRLEIYKSTSSCNGRLVPNIVKRKDLFVSYDAWAEEYGVDGQYIISLKAPYSHETTLWDDACVPDTCVYARFDSFQGFLGYFQVSIIERYNKGTVGSSSLQIYTIDLGDPYSVKLWSLDNKVYLKITDESSTEYTLEYTIQNSNIINQEGVVAVGSWGTWCSHYLDNFYVYIPVADSQPIYLAANAVISDSQPIYLAGTAGISDTQPIYLKGLDTLANNISIYLRGSDDTSDTQSIYINAVGISIDSQPINLRGSYWPFYDEFTGNDGDPWDSNKWRRDTSAGGSITIQSNKGRIRKLSGSDLTRANAYIDSEKDYYLEADIDLTGSSGVSYALIFSLKSSGVWQTSPYTNFPTTGIVVYINYVFMGGYSLNIVEYKDSVSIGTVSIPVDAIIGKIAIWTYNGVAHARYTTATSSYELNYTISQIADTPGTIKISATTSTTFNALLDNLYVYYPSDLFTLPIYFKGRDDLSSNLPIYTRGLDTLTESKAIYLAGSINVLNSLPIYLYGIYAIDSTQPIYLFGTLEVEPIIDVAYLKGIRNLNIYLEGIRELEITLYGIFKVSSTLLGKREEASEIRGIRSLRVSLKGTITK